MGVGELSKPVNSSTGFDPKLKKCIEVLLFVHDKPISEHDFLQVIGQNQWSTDDVRQCLEQIARELVLSDKPYSLEKISGGWQLQTLPEYDPMIRALVEVKKRDSLTRAQLETLAVIAYSQPITRFDIESIRGVTCGPVLKVLQEKDFIRIVGKAEKLGAPVLYGTCKNFLDVFGLNDLAELPEKEEIVKTLSDKLKDFHKSKKDNSENAEAN